MIESGSTESLSKNRDMAVTVHSVIVDLYQSNLTTQTEAEKVMDDMVENILETSTVVSLTNDASMNITEDAIVTKFATMSTQRAVFNAQKRNISKSCC